MKPNVGSIKMSPKIRRIADDVERVRAETVARLGRLEEKRLAVGDETVSDEEVDLVFEAGTRMGRLLSVTRPEASVGDLWTMVPINATKADLQKIKRRIRQELQDAYASNQ